MPQCLVDYTKLLAHEIKGPLLELEVRLRSMTVETPAAHDCLQELQKLQRLVDRVLAWHDAQGLCSESFDLAVLIDRLEQRFHPVIETAGSTLVVENNASRARGDAEATEIVLSNLLENAVHHAGRGVSIALRSTADVETITVSVEDSGAGVPETVGQRVFEPFYRVEREGRGSGLGLFFGRRLAEAQGGSLRLFSPARFVLTLPAPK